MPNLPQAFDAGAAESEARRYWNERGWTDGPPPRGERPRGAIHLFLGAVDRLVSGSGVGFRTALFADVVARAAMPAGRDPRGTLLLRHPPGDPAFAEADATRKEWALWATPVTSTTVEPALRPRVQQMLSRLAEARVLVARDVPMRVCPRCRSPRTPERLVYREEAGPAYLVRVPLAGRDPPASLLVWTDAAWKLLGTSAILVRPDVPYVLARFRREGTEERIVLAKSAVDRLRSWLPGGEVEILEEKPGSAWAGEAYRHPLAVECPALANLAPPAGTVLASPEVTDTGTGVVSVTPAHGAADAAAARALGLPGWQVITSGGQLEGEVGHKYRGLPVADAEAFIVRDLGDWGYLFAELRVRRGVPHCGACGTPVLWLPARAWCLEPGRLDAETLALYARLLPHDPVPSWTDSVPWPASEAATNDDADAPVLLECPRCERMAGPSAARACPCGGARAETRRRLLENLHEALLRWARETPFPREDSAWLVVPEHRRASALLHHLAGQFAAEALPAETRLFSVPFRPETTPSSAPVVDRDAVRLSLFHRESEVASGSSGPSRSDARRLGRLRSVLADVAARNAALPAGPSSASAPGDGRTDLALDEDRALLSRLERMRSGVRSDLDAGRFDRAKERLDRFFDKEVRARHRALPRAPVAAAGAPDAALATIRTLREASIAFLGLAAPFCPFLAEALAQRLTNDRTSVFERAAGPPRPDRIDAEAEGRVDRAEQLRLAIRFGRQAAGLAPGVAATRAVLVFDDEPEAARWRAIEPLLARTTGIPTVEVASPDHPWRERIVEARPNLEEIQRAYPTYAGRVAALLSQLSGRKIRDGLAAQSLSVYLEGRPVPVTPGMVEIREALPPGWLTLPWVHGEICLECPADSMPAARPAWVGLSFDAYRLVEEIDARLAPRGASENSPDVLVAAPPGLEAELASHRATIVRGLRLRRFDIERDGRRYPPTETILGRTRRGERYAIWIPGRPLRPIARDDGHARDRRARPGEETLLRGQRLDEEIARENAELARADQIRSLADALTTAFGRPLLGPAKVAAAWDLGLRSLDDLRGAAPTLVASIPGVDRHLAREVLERLGAPVPAVWPVAASAVGRHVPVPAASGATAAPTAPAEAAPNPPVALLPLPVLRPEIVPHDAGPLVLPRVEPPVLAIPDASMSPATESAINGVALDEAPALEPVLSEPAATVPGGVRLWVGEDAEPARRAFLDRSAADPGLCVLRELPDQMRTRIGRRNVSIVWLSNTKRPYAHPPADLDGLRDRIREAYEGGTRSVLFEGIEYLVLVTDAPRIAQLLGELDALGRARGLSVDVLLRPSLMSAEALALLRARFPEPPPPAGS
jgi:hypothetical protein